MRINNTSFINEASEEIYLQTYKFHGDDERKADIDINDTHLRVAKDLAQNESDKETVTDDFLTVLENFAFMPGGRITSNAGTGLKGTTYINCFVDGFVGESQDSMEGILDTLRRQALILKSEGGYGFNSDVMRPRGSYIGGIGNESPGSVEMLDMWDTQSAVITKGSGKKSKKGKQKIRKGAQMVTKSVWHPDIEEYITAKQTENRLTKFNMSILCSDEFMNAVKEHKSWDLKFPDYENCKELYNKEWDGNIKSWESKGYPVKVYKTYSDANELWDLISKSTYNRNEPGVLFVDTINRLNNLWYCEYINATNPCGEQILPIGGVCLLGSLNLAQFVNDDRTFNFDKFKSFIPKAVRLMDNVNDITYVPLESQRQSLKNKRRIGLGIMGYGSALLMMGLRYGSKEALNFTDKMMSCLANTAYQASALLAREKGSFPLYDEKRYLQSNFAKNVLSQETIDLIKKYGIRNSHLLSIQPTGNSSFFGNNVSGGGEPIFLFEYIRTAIQPFAPEGLDVPKNIDFSNKTYESTTEWKWKKEGDENMLWTEFNGQIWKYDKNRGLLKEIKVEDYGLWWLRQRGIWDENADWAVNAYNLTVSDHVNTMGVLAKYLDSAMSKTINLPQDYPYEDFKDVYFKCWETGVIKGCTTYREGTMAAVLSKDSTTESNDNEFKYHHAPKRPKELPCDVFQITAKGKKWTIVVGLYDGKPYECFGIEHSSTEIPENFKKGFLVKEGRGKYSLKNEKYTINDVTSNMTDEEEALTRMISTALRHGSSIDFIVEQLNKSQGTVISFNKAIARVLSKYAKELRHEKVTCQECGGTNISFEEGCFKCYDCGSSKCS
jgi:ribonucleoside-diphosphate reductase alpha chain